MELSFETRYIRDVCEKDEIAKGLYGDLMAEKLQSRLADLRAAIHVSDLVAGNPMQIQGEPNIEYKVDLSKDCHLVFAPNHTRPVKTSQGEINWERVSRIKILEIRSQYE